MRRPLSLAVLATMAALLWAPLTAAAAAPNTLTAAWVTPMSGTPATAFVLRVRFTGRNGARATSVAAAIEGRTIPMGLASGTTANGTWSTSIRLPVGSWTTTFVSTATKGLSPSIAGPTISVVAAMGAPNAAGSAANGQPTEASVDARLPQAAPAAADPSAAPYGEAVMGVTQSEPPGPDAGQASPFPGDSSLPLAMALMGVTLVAMAGLGVMMLGARNRELDRASALAGARDAEAALMARTIRLARLRAPGEGVPHAAGTERRDR